MHSGKFDNSQNILNLQKSPNLKKIKHDLKTDSYHGISRSHIRQQNDIWPFSMIRKTFVIFPTVG